MADEEEIAVTVVPDEQANIEQAVKEEKVEVKDDVLEDLKAQYKALEERAQLQEKRVQEEEERRRQAEIEAAKHRQDAESARKRETSSHLDTITTAIGSSKQEVESAKAAIRAAKAAGDVEAEIEAQERLAEAKASLVRLDEAKSDIEARIKAPPKQQVPTDPVEAFATGRTPQTAAWIRAHPEFVRSERGLKKLTAADAIAQAEDLIPDTPEYFARVEEYLGLTKKEEKTETKTEAKTEPKPKSAAPPVAPGASVSSNGATGGAAVTLTAREAQAAVDGTVVWNFSDPKGKFKKGDPVGLQEYARRKLALMKSGQYDRSFTES